MEPFKCCEGTAGCGWAAVLYEYPDVKCQLSIHYCKITDCHVVKITMGGMQHIPLFVSPTKHYQKRLCGSSLSICINAIPNNVSQVCDLENKFKGTEMLFVHFLPRI